MNRRKSYVLASVLAVAVQLTALLLLRGEPVPSAGNRTAGSKDIAVYFSPEGGCTDAIVREIATAKSEIELQAYAFTSAPIAEAIAKAHARGVKVTVVLDKSQSKAKYSGATYLLNHQVPVFIDAKHAIAHNKIIIIDGQTVITGSFNFSKAAEEENAENLLILHRPDIAKAYMQNFQDHLSHALPYTR